MRTTKRRAAVAAVAVVAGIATFGAAAYAANSGGEDGTTTTATTAAAESGSLDRGAPVRNVEGSGSVAPTGNARGSTVVTFTEAAVDALGPLSPQGAKPGAFGLTANGTAVQAAFPIIGNGNGGIIDHVGGLTFTDGDSTLTLRGYRIDTSEGTLSATAAIKGQRPSTLEFLKVAPTATAPGCTVSAELTLAKPAADALSLVFGVPDLTGAPIGTACVTLR